MPEYNLYRAARIRALREVYCSHSYDPSDPKSCPPPSEEYVKRRILRDVSQRFHIPLFPGSVEDVPLEDLLQAHYESQYEDLASASDPEAAQRWQDELERATETEAEEAARLQAEREDKQGMDDEVRRTEAQNLAADLRKAALELAQESGVGPRRKSKDGWGSSTRDFDPNGKREIKMKFPL